MKETYWISRSLLKVDLWGWSSLFHRISCIFPRYLVTIHPSLFHHGEPQIILSLLFHSLEVDAQMHELYDVLGIHAIQNLLTSLILPVLTRELGFYPGGGPRWLMLMSTMILSLVLWSHSMTWQSKMRYDSYVLPGQEEWDGAKEPPRLDSMLN